MFHVEAGGFHLGRLGELVEAMRFELDVIARAQAGDQGRHVAGGFGVSAGVANVGGLPQRAGGGFTINMHFDGLCSTNGLSVHRKRARHEIVAVHGDDDPGGGG